MSLLITLEGLDKMGKTTLLPTVIDEMKTDGSFHPWTYASKEPGSMWPGKIPAQLRKMVLETPDLKPIERELLFYVDASLHGRFIDNQVDAIVVSDRGLWSHLAYLRAYLKTGQIDYNDYLLCKNVIAKVCRQPDCIIYLKGTVELMKARAGDTPKDAIEANGDKFYSYVLETYEDLAAFRAYEGKPLLTLDANDPTDRNTMKVVGYLKEVFTHEELRNGNCEVC